MASWIRVTLKQLDGVSGDAPPAFEVLHLVDYFDVVLFGVGSLQGDTFAPDAAFFRLSFSLASKAGPSSLCRSLLGRLPLGGLPRVMASKDLKSRSRAAYKPVQTNKKNRAVRTQPRCVLSTSRGPSRGGRLDAPLATPCHDDRFGGELF